MINRLKSLGPLTLFVAISYFVGCLMLALIGILRLIADGCDQARCGESQFKYGAAILPAAIFLAGLGALVLRWMRRGWRATGDR